MPEDTTRNESVDTATRRDVLARDEHRCQVCGQLGTKREGPAELEVHHIDRDADELEEHAMSNLITLCRACHNWHHHQINPNKLDVELSDADEAVLLSHDLEILDLLVKHGPATTGEIATGLSVDMTQLAVRERLWTLMGLDGIVDDRETQLIDQDWESLAWGLPDQIEQSARGHVPDDPKTLLQRAEDERVRRAIENGCSRETVAEVYGIHPTTTRQKERRARAYDFPLEDVLGSHVPTPDESESLATPPIDDDDSPPTGFDGEDPVVRPGQPLPPKRDVELTEHGADETWIRLDITDDARPSDTVRTQFRRDLSQLAHYGLFSAAPTVQAPRRFTVTERGVAHLRRYFRDVARMSSDQHPPLEEAQLD